MRKAIYISLLLALTANPLFADTHNKWSTGLVLGEMGASCGLSFAAGIGLYLIGGDSTSRTSLLAGFSIGSVAGVLLVGEIAGTPSDNPKVTFGVTALGAIVPIAMARVIDGPVADIYADGMGDTPGGGYLAVPFICAPVCTILYNIFKEPKEEETRTESRIKITPYSDILISSNGYNIPTYGIEVAF